MVQSIVEAHAFNELDLWQLYSIVDDKGHVQILHAPVAEACPYVIGEAVNALRCHLFLVY